METTKSDAGSKSWLKERAAISAAHRRQKTDPAAARLIEKADQLHKERTQKNLRETVDEDDEAMDGFPETTVKKNEAEDEDLEDIDAIVNVPPPEEIVVKIAHKPTEEDTIASDHGKEASEDVYRSFAESVLEQGLTTESELELSFDLKPEDIKIKEDEEEEEEEEEEGEKDEENEEENEEKKTEEEREEKEEKEEKEEEETQEEQADLDEADNAKEIVQEKLKDTNAEINHNEEIKGDVKDQEDDKSEESTLTKEADVDTVPKNND